MNNLKQALLEIAKGLPRDWDEEEAEERLRQERWAQQSQEDEQWFAEQDADDEWIEDQCREDK